MQSIAKASRLDRNLAAADGALAAMRKGQSLYLQYQDGRPLWSLSGGQSGDLLLLLRDSASQTWRIDP